MNIKYLPIFFLPLGCVGIGSIFQAVAAVIFLYSYFHKNIKFAFKDFFSNKIVKYSFCFFCFSVLGLGISDFISKGTIKESWNIFQRILPFVLVGLFALKSEKFFKYAWIGLTISLLIIDINVIYSFYSQGHWRPITMFNSPNRLGAVLILLLPFVSVGLYKFRRDYYLNFLAGITFILGILSLLISGSRGAICGLTGAAFICFMLINYKRTSFKKFIINTFCLMVIILFSALIIYNIFPEIFRRSYDMERIYLWQSALKMFLDYPVLGVGAGNFNEVYLNGYISPFAHEPALKTPHNIFLWYLSERGLVTTLPFIFLIGYQIYIFSKNVLNQTEDTNVWCCCGLIICLGMVIHGMFDTMMNNRTYQLMYWFLYGLSCYSIIYENKKDINMNK